MEGMGCGTNLGCVCSIASGCVRAQVGQISGLNMDCGKVVRDLGLRATPAADTIRATVQTMLSLGVVKPQPTAAL